MMITIIELEKMKLKHYDLNADAIQKLRSITTTLELIEVNYPSPDLPKLTPKELEYISNECIKAYDFIVMKPDYLISYPTPERFYEWLERFESMVLGTTPRMLGGEPFQFGYYSEHYKQNKSEVVTKFLGDLRKEMQSMLEESQKLTSPIVEPGDIGGT